MAGRIVPDPDEAIRIIDSLTEEEARVLRITRDGGRCQTTTSVIGELFVRCLLKSDGREFTLTEEGERALEVHDRLFTCNVESSND